MKDFLFSDYPSSFPLDVKVVNGDSFWKPRIKIKGIFIYGTLTRKEDVGAYRGVGVRVVGGIETRHRVPSSARVSGVRPQSE